MSRFANRSLSLALVVALPLAGCVDEAPPAHVAHAALDRSDCPPGSNVIEGTAGDDVLVGTIGSDCILGHGGNDTIDGQQGDDFLVGGDGDDDLHGGNGTDLLFGEAGDDTISGGNGRDTIVGGDGNDVLVGDNGGDTVLGGAGNDVILDDRGPNTTDGGEGTDGCSAPGCELPAPTACSSDADCGADQTCTGGACVFCIADSSCDDAMTCTGVEQCFPVAGCQPGTNLVAGYDVGLSCSAGVGECAAAGREVCDGVGGQLCNAVPGVPGPDDGDCDGRDDDCDGITDEDTRAEACNGADDDCDGLVDEGTPDTDGDTLCDSPAIDPCPFHADPSVTASPTDVIVRGTMTVLSTHQENPSLAATNVIPSLAVKTDFGETITDCNGVFTFVAPAGSTVDPSETVEFDFRSQVPGPGGISSRMQVVDSEGNAWGTYWLHFGFDASTPTGSSTDAMGRTVITYDPIRIETSEAELFRIGVLVLDDYHRVFETTFPEGSLDFMRHSGVLFELTPFTPYAHVEMSSTVLDVNLMDTPGERERVLFHETGHIIRNRFDGGRSHWDADNGLYTFLACHTGIDIYSEGYAFSEGWAAYWSRARAAFARIPPVSMPFPAPSSARPMTDRDASVVSSSTPDAWSGTQTFTDYCDGMAGPRGVALTPTHVDWVEDMIADRILELGNTGCAGATNDEADATMLRVLQPRPGGIHSLWEFEQALCADVPACCAFTRSDRNALCPPDYSDRGLTCEGPTSHSITHLPR